MPPTREHITDDALTVRELQTQAADFGYELQHVKPSAFVLQCPQKLRRWMGLVQERCGPREEGGSSGGRLAIIDDAPAMTKLRELVGDESETPSPAMYLGPNRLRKVVFLQPLTKRFLEESVRGHTYCAVCMESRKGACLLDCRTCHNLSCQSCLNEVVVRAHLEGRQPLCPFCRAVVT